MVLLQRWTRGKNDRPLHLATVLAVVAITLGPACLLNIWQDEAFTLHSVSHGARYAFSEALHFEQSAPLYFVVLSLLHAVRHDVWFLRLFSIACAAVTVALTPSIARRYVPSLSPLLITVAVAWNPFLIWSATEMRPYAMTIAVSAGLMRVFYDGFLSERRSVRAYVLYAILATIALYTQYYVAFLIAAQAVAVLLYRRERIAPFVACSFAAFAAFIPVVAIVPSQVQNYRTPFDPPSAYVSAASVALALMRYLLPLPARVAKDVYLVIGPCLLVAAFYARRRFSNVGAAPMTIVAVAAVCFVFATYAAHVIVLTRHVASLYVPVVVAVYAVLTQLKAPLARRAILVWLALTFAASSFTIVRAYAPLAKSGDWIRVNAYIRSNEHPGEPIVVLGGEDALPFAYYYHGKNAIVPVPQGVDFSHYDASRFIISEEKQLLRLVPGTHRLWLITVGNCRSQKSTFQCYGTDRFIRGHFTVISDASFFDSRVRLLERRPGDRVQPKVR